MIGYALLERPAEGPQTLNWLILALDIAGFRAAGDYDASCKALLDRVKATPSAPGFEEVLLPGEPEARSAARRRAEGIPVPESTWSAIAEAAQSVGVTVAELGDAVT
jgi:LDH2 family malate/lactate/ureidoglycolate dehydrogenase